MSSKHTPGPWAVHDHPTDPYQYGHHVTTEDGLTICSVTYQLPVSTPHGVEEATRVANARLIAAAPELLDLLSRVAYHMEGGIRMEYPASPKESPQPASEWDHEADRLAGEVRRLLAKSTGAA